MAKSKAVRQRFFVTVTTTCEVEVDPSLLPDDEWRSKFYNIRTLSDVARHVAYNYVVNGSLLKDLDGFADRDNRQATVKITDTDTEAEPLLKAAKSK